MISFGVNAIIMLGVTLTSLFVFMKSIQHTTTMSRKVIAVAWCLAWSVFYAATISLTPFLLFRILLCVTTIVFVFFLTRRELEARRGLKMGRIFEVIVSAYLLSFGISYVLNYVAGLLVLVPYALFTQNEIVADTPIDFNQPIYLLIRACILIVQFVLAALIFRIRRLRKGFPFIFNKFTIVAALFFTGIILILVTWVNRLSMSENVYSGYNLDIAGIIIAGIGIYILTRRLIKIFQKKRAQQNTDNHFEKLYREEQEKNNRLSEINKTLQTALHKFTSRIDVMETAFEQGNVTLKDIQNLQKDWQDELSAIKGKKPLPSTNVTAIDNMFAHFAKLFAADEISFSLIVNGSIIYMVENIIDLGKLETLIGDHLKDAQIAVNSDSNPFRSIMVVLGLVGEHYEFTVFDSGIPFEVDTLERLGVERVTTHTDEGGNGIGFLTTFETMKEYNASLIISEQKQSSADYSKSVSIRFDGKNQYTIKTYRSDEFAANDRYIIVDR